MTTVAELLQLDGPKGPTQLRAQYDALTENASRAGKTDDGKRAHPGWWAIPGLAAALSDALLRQLHATEMADLLDDAWNDASAVQAAIDRTRDGSSGPASIALSPHSLTLTLPMRVEVDHVEQPVLEPTLVVELKLDGVVLTVDRGRVTEWSAAVGSASAELRLDQALLLPISRVEKEFRIGVIDIRAAGDRQTAVRAT